MKNVGFVRRYLLQCFSPSATTTTTTSTFTDTTTTNAITEVSGANKAMVTNVTTTTTTTTVNKRSTTTRPQTKKRSTANRITRYSGNGYNGNGYNGNVYNGNEYNGNEYNGNEYMEEKEKVRGDTEGRSSCSSMEDGKLDYYPNPNPNPNQKLLPSPTPTKTVVIGTFYGNRRGHICFCIQKDRLNHSNPQLLLELSIATDDLVKEMQGQLVRIVLECDSSSNTSSCKLLSIPIWTMYVNGRKVGFAARRKPTDKDRLILQTMQSTTVGAGVIPEDLIPLFPNGGGRGGGGGGGVAANGGGEVIFMRANYNRVVGGFDSESFHLTNPDGSSSTQELSVFLMRSRLTNPSN